MNYHYEFGNLNHHGFVDIVDENGNHIEDLEIWACEDFTKDEWQDIGFCCSRCVNRFSKSHKDMKVSENVLIKLGIISKPLQEDCVRE
jgi:hypothetical protein